MSQTDTTSIYSSDGSSSSANSTVCIRDDINGYIRSINIPVVKYMDRTEVEAVPKRVFANAHTYHINSISLNSDQETFMSADDLRINLWHIEITNQSFSEFFHFSLLILRKFMRDFCHLRFFRYCGHKTGQYGRANRSYNSCRVSSKRM